MNRYLRVHSSLLERTISKHINLINFSVCQITTVGVCVTLQHNHLPSLRSNISGYSLFKIRSAKHYSQLTQGNHEKTFLRVLIGQLAIIFCTSYFEQTIDEINFRNRSYHLMRNMFSYKFISKCYHFSANLPPQEKKFFNWQFRAHQRVLRSTPLSPKQKS